MMQFKQTIAILKFVLPAVLLAGFLQPLGAEELKLSGRLILQDGDQGWDEKTPDPNSLIKNGYTIGLAVFDDGTIAEKQYVFSQNNRETDGNLSGFTFYIFENGDYLLMEFEAAWNENGFSGEYTKIIEGTGRFSGVTGGGTFIGVEGPWYETILTDFTLNLVLAKNE